MKKLLTLYIGILFVNLSFAQSKINDTITHDGYSGISIYRFIENYKDSVLKEPDIKLIRNTIPVCMGDHGGTFDVDNCKTYINDELVRVHSYGWRIIQNRFNDDKYYKDGKLIKWILAEEIKNVVEGKSYTRIHIYEL